MVAKKDIHELYIQLDESRAACAAMTDDVVIILDIQEEMEP